MKQENLKKVGGALLVVAGLGLGFYVFLALADVITFIWAFYHFDNVIEVYGTTNEFVNKGIAAVLAGLIVVFMDKVAISVAKRNKKWVPIVVGIMIAIYAVMYLVSWPYHGALTDVTSGDPAKQCYRDQFGLIQTIGLGAKAGPAGETVRPCTKEDQQEYQRQTGGQGRSFLDGLFGNPSEANSLHVDVEQIEILPDATVLLFAVKRVNNSRLGRFYQPHYWNYLSDENGQSYDLVRDNATYPDWVDAKSHKDVDHYEDEKHAETHIVRPDEVYRFTATYTPLNPGIQHLRLHDSRFGEVDLDKQLFANRVSELVGKANAEPQNLGALLAVAGAYYNAKDYAHAIPWYESAFRIDPRNVNVGNLLSWSYHQTGQFASAEDWNNRLLVLDPRNSTTLFFQGLYRYEAGDKEGAAASWRTVIEIDTGGAASREARAHLASLESEKAALAAPAPSSSPPKQVETEEVPEPPPPKLFYENHPIITKVINRTLLTILGIFVLFVLALFVNVYKEGRSEARASAKRACIPVGSVSVEATKTRFVARERFVVAESPVRISRLSDDFKKWFLGKIEEPFAGSILSYGEHDFVVDRDVVRELGKKKAETTLAEIFSLLKKQGNGEEGPLRTDWHANAFYVRDVNRVLRMVFVGWRNNDWRRKDDNGWHVSTFSFKDGKVRFGTRRIFFRAL